MIWQDVLMMVTGFGFFLALIPTLRSKQKPVRSSCWLTTALLAGNCLALSTLGLWMAFGSTALTLVAWFILTIQRR